MSDNTAQIGIALHQIKRGREYRRLIKPPPGYDLLEFDFAGQEFRWMAVASGDATMLSLCEPGEDAHSYMGAQIAQIDYRELVRRVKAGEEEAEFQRKLGKFCVAEGELVLTDQGLVPIEQVSLGMRVWDGVEWVAHEGLIYQGEREVITYAGLTATPDHMVYLKDGSSMQFQEIAIGGKKIAVTCANGLPIPKKAGKFKGLFTYFGRPSKYIPKHVAKVYDITNAGPRNRFTCSNYLISNCNLSFQYRVGSKTALMKARTDYEMDLDEMFIKQMLATYKATFPGIPGNSGQVGYWNSAIHKARKAGYAETFAGRRVQLRGSWTGRDAWPMESTAINYPIQGTGADQKYLALAVLRNLLPKYNAYFYMELHDGIFTIVPQDRSREAGEVIKKSLSNLPYKQAWGIDLPIQFPVDSKISSESWGDLKGL